jgi:hypothetical protein
MKKSRKNNKVELTSYSARTNAKLEYAKVHLEELRSYQKIGSGDSFERAHHESFLFHLLGAKDTFLQELNFCYKCKFPPSKVKEGLLLKELKKRKLKSTELQELINLQKDQNSWLSLAKELRHQATHRHHIGRHFFTGGPESGKVEFKDPRSGKFLDLGAIEIFDLWYQEMCVLLHKLRRKAIKNI